MLGEDVEWLYELYIDMEPVTAASGSMVSVKTASQPLPRMASSI